MAELPTVADVARAILDASKSFNPRPGTSIPMLAVFLKLSERGFVSDELNAGFASMQADGLIEPSGNPRFFRLTEAGFAAM
jgi:hypothetical protein